MANGFSCREQIVQTTARTALHPAQVFKMALDQHARPSHDAYPERRYEADPARERRRVVGRGLALIATVAATVATAAAIRHWRGRPGRR